MIGTDGTQMGQHTVNVAISNPPKRKTKQGADEPMETSTTSATKLQETSGKTNFTPRVLGAK